MGIAVYAGAFDPLSLGHLSVIRSAARIFDHVRVLVAVNPAKSALFELEERVVIIDEVVHRMPQVSVDSTRRLVVDYALEIGAGFLIRGLRTSLDADYEIQMAHENRELAPEIATIFLPAAPAYAGVSSTQIKELARQGGDLSQLCPPSVERRIERRLGRTEHDQAREGSP